MKDSPEASRRRDASLAARTRAAVDRLPAFFSWPLPDRSGGGGRRPAPAGRALLGVVAAAALLVAGCGDEAPQGPDRGGGPAAVTVRASIEAAGDTASQQAGGGGLAAAYEASEVAEVRLERASDGAELADREVSFDPGGGGAELSLELAVEAERVPAALRLALRRGSDPLFEGATSLTLVAGETTTVELSLAPVPDAVVAPEGPVTFTALGDTAELAAAVVFATGDTIPGASVSWSSADSSVADVDADGTVVADAPGETEVVATHGELSASVAVEVDPQVATVALEPDAATFGQLRESTAFEVRVTDANGHPVEGEPVTWTSTDPQVAAVDGEGRAEARGDGTASVVAEAMGTADTASVVVDLGPTGQVGGRVGEVQPPGGSASVQASGSAAASRTSAAAIPTEGAGGVEVRFLRGGEVVSRTTTAPDGTWTSPAIPPGIYTLEYASPDLETVRQPGVEVAEGTTGSLAEVPMVPASDQPGTVAGGVLNSRTGDGVAGAAVELRAGFENPDGEIVATGTAGADGGYALEGVAAGTYTVTADAEDFAPATIPGVALGGETFGGQDLELVPPPAVAIGSPAAGASFSADALIPFEGSADDPVQGALTGDALVWTSDLDGEIGTGESFSRSLSVGSHQITLTATNDRGASGEASVDIEVEEATGEQPPATRIFVTEQSAGDLTVIDPSTNNDVVARIPVGSSPTAVAVRGTSGPVYVARSTFPGEVTVVDVASNTVTGGISIANPRDIAFTPDGSTAYVTSRGELSNVSVVDVASASVTTAVPMPNGPEGVVVTPDGSSVYVTNQFSDEVEVIDAASNFVVATIPVGESPGQLAAAPDGSEIYVADSDPNVAEQGAQISVIDPSTNTVDRTISLFGVTRDVAVTPDGSRLYVALSSPDEVAVVDVASGQRVDTVSLPVTLADPRRIIISADGTEAYVTIPGAAGVGVIDLSTNTITTNITLPGSPFGVAIND